MWLLLNSHWNRQDQEADKLAWVTSFYQALLPYLPGKAYVNLPDRDIPNYLEQYYAENLPRLVEVKAQYDPTDVFHYPQSIPVTLADPPIPKERSMSSRSKTKSCSSTKSSRTTSLVPRSEN